MKSGAKVLVLVLALCLGLPLWQPGIFASADGNAVVVVDTPSDESESHDNAELGTVEANIPTFKPTHEWQEILPGQGIPRGLHVRMNLETGKKEAKLIDGEDGNNPEQPPGDSEREDASTQPRSVTVTTDAQGEVVDVSEDVGAEKYDQSMADQLDEVKVVDEGKSDKKEPNWNHEKMLEVLQALPEPPLLEGMGLDEAHSKLSKAEFRREIIKLWKKRQADLKQAMDSMQDDAKYLAKLLDQLRDAEKEDDTGRMLQTLEVLEWEVQDLDKTHVFNFIGGFGIINEYLNSTNLPVRASAAWVIGTAVKNYRDGQEWAIDAGVVPKLLDSLALDIPLSDKRLRGEVMNVKKKSVYALSSLVRFNTRGQRLFMQKKGIEAMEAIFDDSHSTSVQLKTALLVHDLLLETPLEDASSSSSPQDSPLLAIQSSLQEPVWCEHLVQFLKAKVSEISYKQAIELLDAVVHQLPSCYQIHKDGGVLAFAQQLNAEWQAGEKADEMEREELATLVDLLRGEFA